MNANYCQDNYNKFGLFEIIYFIALTHDLEKFIFAGWSFWVEKHLWKNFLTMNSS